MTEAQVFTILSSVIGVGIALAALIIGLIAWVRSDVRRLETDLRAGQTRLETDLRDGQSRIETRLLAVEKEQARTSGLLEGLGLTGRATPDSQPQPAAAD